MERAEKIGLGVATAGHVLLFGLLSTGFLATPNPLKLNSPPMDVSLVDDVALKSVAPQISTQPPPPSVAPEKGPTQDAKPAPEPAPAPKPEPEPEPEPTPAPPPPKPKPQPKPKPTPAPPEKPAPKAPPKPVPPQKDVPKAASKPKATPEKPAPAKPAPAAKAKPAPAKPAAPAKAKASPERPRTAAPSATSGKPASKPKTDAPARASGAGKADKPRGSLLGKDFLKGIDSASDAPRTPAPPPAAAMGPQQKAALDRLISQQIYPHLHLPSGADVELLVASLDVRLDKDGSVIGKPTVIDVTGINASNSPQAGLYKERAVQAVMQASPFRGMPAEFYDQWNHLRPLRIYARKAQ